MVFIFGILAALFALTLQVFVWVFYPDLFTVSLPLTSATTIALVFLAFSEESARILFSRQYLKNTSSRYPLIAALIFAIGFSFPEVVLTYWNGFSWNILGVSAFHILTTLITFWWLSQNRNRTAIAILLGILTGLHIAFNLTTLSLAGS